MSRDMDDLRHPEWSVPGSGGMSDLRALHESDASTRWFANGTLVVVAPGGNVFDVYTKERAELIVALRNAYASGDLVHRSVVDGERLNAVADRDAEWETLRAKHAAFVEAAKAFIAALRTINTHRRDRGRGAVAEMQLGNFERALADLEASDD